MSLYKLNIRSKLRYVAIAFLLSASSFGATTSYKATMTAANTLSILGGLGLLGVAVLDIVAENTNATQLDVAFGQLSASSLIAFASGSALAIVAGELNSPALLERIDEVATGMTAVGSVLISCGIWNENFNAIKGGAVFLTTFFVSKAHLVPLILQKHGAYMRASGKVLIVTLTVLGNVGGALLVWSIFDTVRETGRHALQAGIFILGVTIPVALTGLTVNMWRQPQA